MILEGPTLYAEYADRHARGLATWRRLWRRRVARLVSQNEFYAALAPPTTATAATVVVTRVRPISHADDVDDGGRRRRW